MLLFRVSQNQRVVECADGSVRLLRLADVDEVLAAKAYLCFVSPHSVTTYVD